MIDTFKARDLVRDNVLKMKPYASAREEFKKDGNNYTYLDANENPFENGLNRYPDPQQRALKGMLAEFRGIREENILLGNGSDEILDLLFRAFCEPGRDNIITLPPTYGMYKVLAALNDVENREVPLLESFQPDLEKILQEADGRSKLLLLCSPNNPTGNSIAVSSVQCLLEKFNGLVVIDEAYIDFSGQDSWLGSLQQYPNLVITQTFSKAFGLAGIRVGICYASQEILEILNKIKPPYNLNTLSLQKAAERLRNGAVPLEIAAIVQQRELLTKALQELEFVKAVFPSDANFLLVRVDDATGKYERLLEKQVVLRNRCTEIGCEDCLRLTVGTQKENEQLISALKELAG